VRRGAHEPLSGAMMQCVTVCYSALQCVAVYCNVLCAREPLVWRGVAVCCSELQ